jgi:hypothetical protein
MHSDYKAHDSNDKDKNHIHCCMSAEDSDPAAVRPGAGFGTRIGDADDVRGIVIRKAFNPRRADLRDHPVGISA